jgi:hypothetical protein
MRLTAAEDHDNLESSIDRIMEELVRLTEVDLTVNAAEEDVTKVAVTAIRTAIHAAGQGTQAGQPSRRHRNCLPSESQPRPEDGLHGP